MYLSALIVPSQMSKLPIRWTPTQARSITDNGVLTESEVSLNPENMASMVPKSCELDSSLRSTLLHCESAQTLFTSSSSLKYSRPQ